ncbi:glycoside hydrolase family 47 protein [Annulohypoxylon maeteangense]|uniref:glycoside hydrolase family 47 protein n=1 Tax=Annulohypoxylon maeteangense TaxID=1927788 RepID=UPI0020081EED|nr:glycoside hydrolase family 47 protein [Annulohypoxylon maeteangense]KAI0882280.1 glycoside hydrolase family 47 protein [Annulohypoxylon maeteangense]
MFVENVEWQVRQQPHNAMIAIFRRKTRVAAALFLVLVLYLLVGLIPEHRDTLFGFTYVRTSYDWSKQSLKYPISEYTPLPTGRPLSLPKVQYAFTTDTSPAGVAREEVLASRRAEVKSAFVKSWTSYKNVGFGYDELMPVSGKGRDAPGFGGWGATLVDSLSTLWIMGLKEDFYEAAAAAVTIDWADTRDNSCNFFETTIRHLGGLLGAYDLSLETALLEKAIELGDMLFMAYDTPNHMPPFWLDFDDAKRGNQLAGYHDPSASVTSSSLEFSRLAQLTGNDKYYDVINRVALVLDEWQNKTALPGMWPTFFDFNQLQLDSDSSFTLGALADSLYEYLPKTFAILGGLEPMYEKLYRGSMDTVIKNLLFRPKTPDQDDILFSGNVYVSSDTGPHLTAEVQHLGCFVGGMFGLGGKLFNIPEHLEIGEKITRGCVWAYDAMPTGIMPEIFNLEKCDTLDPCEWDEEQWENEADTTLKKGFKNARDPRYLLRPEAVESVFLMYRMTGNSEYQEMAWRMFQSIRNATETDLAFSSINSVRNVDTVKSDSMESFWLAETLRYLYLTFSSPDLVNLDDYVLNTEAHPLKRPR